jgi:DNA modification methylase
MIELNKIYNMDCLKGMKLIDDNSIDLIVTDPPYNLNKSFENDNLSENNYISFLSPILNEMARIIKPKHSVIIFFDNGKKLPLFWKCLFNSNLIFQKGCTFYKPNDCTTPHNHVLRKSEVFYICSKTKELHHDGETYIHDCLINNYLNVDKNLHHPTIKNIDMIKDIIRSHSIKNDIILDPFMGSGTTAIACLSLNRNFIGFELDDEYYNMINKRILDYKSQIHFFIMG